MMAGWLIIFLLGTLLTGWGLPLRAAEPVTMTFATGYGRDTFLFRRFQLLYTEAFRRIGMQFKLVSLPKDQALSSANLGLFDGDSSRVPELEHSPEFVNLIRIDVITNRSHHVAFVKSRRLKVYSWADIKAQHLKIAYPRGQVYAAHQVEALQLPGSRVLTGSSCEELLQWLDTGRVDVVIDNLGNCLEIRRSERFKAIQPHIILGEDNNYPYLHKRHKDLALKFSKALKATLDDPGIHAKLLLLEKESMQTFGRVTNVQIFTPYDFEPFVLDRATQDGLIYDLQRYLNALADGAYRFEVQTLPRIPVERLEKMRELAIVPFVTPSWFRDEKFLHFDWSDSLLEDQNVIVSAKKAALESLAPDVVKGKTLCGSSRLRRDEHVQNLVNDGIIRQTLSPNTLHCLQMVAHGRADFYVSGRMLLAYYMQKADLSGQLHISTGTIRSFSRRILITPKGTELLGWLNQKIESLTKSQSWRNVMKSYHVPI